MSGPATRDPAFAERVRASFGKQGLMVTIGASLARVAPGEVVIEMPVAPEVSQQHGFVHGGAVGAIADSAAGYASLSLMPAGVGVLTVEYKINFLAPAAGQKLVASGRVVKPGRQLMVAEARVEAEDAAGARKLVALLNATMMVVEGRAGVSD